MIEHSNEVNSFTATCGEIKYSRTYFKSKETGKRKYLADEAAGIEPHMRISSDVVIKALEQAVETSYRISGENAIYTDDIISKQAVMKQVHELEIPPAKYDDVKEKKKVKVLYVEADEDHVSLQFNSKKGDLKIKNGRKHNTAMPKLIYVHEGIEKEGKKSKRHKLKNKWHFGSAYAKPEELWEEVLHYIDVHYDNDALEKKYISGDVSVKLLSDM